MTIFGAYSTIESATTLLASPNPTQPRLYLHNPAVVFAARAVVLDPLEWPISFVAYDTVTIGDYSAIKPGMLLLLGSVPLGDDLGRQRVRGPDVAATTISIFVGRSSQGTNDGELYVTHGAYITVVDDRRVWAKMPFIDADGGIFKDSDLEVEWRTTTPPPVAIMGTGLAGTVDADTLLMTVQFNGQLSYATADGATITDYLWDIADGTLVAGTLADDVIFATFPAGFRYVGLTVTDSNGKSATTERPVFADDPEHSLSFDGFAIESESYTDAGKKMTIRALEDMPRAIYPDGTLCMIWAREPGSTADRTHMLIVGWLDQEDATIGAGKYGLLRDTTLTILDVAARLDQLPGFPQALADDETRDTAKIPTITWNYMIAPTMDLYMHYLWAWHSTALEVADFIWSGTGDAYKIAIKSSDGDSLWNQVKRIAQAMIPGYVLTCDQAGAIRVVPDPNLLDIADRSAVVQFALTEDNFSDIRFTYQRNPRVHWLRTGALVVQASITFNAPVAGAPPTVYLPTVFSIAPGATPGQGLGEVDDNEGLVASQAVLNSETGHRYAAMNAVIQSITLTLIQDDGAAGATIPWRVIEPALKEWVSLTVTVPTAAQRGWPFATLRCLPKEVSIRYNTGKTGLTRTLELTLTPETSGPAAATVVKPTDIPAVGEDPAVVPSPIPPPDMGLVDGQELVAGIGQFSLYRTADFQTPSGSGGPTWESITLTGSDEILTFVVDPFSPGYLTGTGTIDGWVATDEKIYRISDFFGTVIITPVVTFATTALWRTIQASFGTYFVTGLNPWLICISYYGNAAGHTGTWATYSIDGGVTWAAEVLVSAFYDSGGASNPIGLYCSPKTPGLAYTVAHVETATPATTAGYVSHDWGATWTAMAATEDPAFPLPRWGSFDDSESWTLGAVAPTASVTVSSSAGPGDGTIATVGTLVLGAPANTKRLVVHGAYNGLNTRVGAASAGTSRSFPRDGALTRTVLATTSSGTIHDNVPYSGTFDYEYTFSGFAGGDWPGNRDLIEAGAPASPGSANANVRFRLNQLVNALSGSASASETLTVTVTEIELDDGTTYTPLLPGIIVPIHGQAGEIHSPWAATEDVLFYGSLDRTGSPVTGLQRAMAGVVTDVSPVAGIGINHGHFAVRADDSAAAFMLAAVSNATQQAVYGSTDGGDTWTAILLPATGSEPYSAAFGLDETEIFIWGPAEYITFSSDSGATNDDRSGNLGALSATKILGIAGGPTP